MDENIINKADETPADIDSVEMRLRKLLKESVKFPDAVDKIGIDDELVNVGLDSFIFIKLVVTMEKEFGFEFDDDALEVSRFPTMKDLIEYINENRVS